MGLKERVVAIIFCSCILIGAGNRLWGDAAMDQKVADLLAKMTIEEKVGQMTQVELGVVSKGEGGRDEPHAIDPAKLRDAVVSHHVGSILNVINGAYTVDHWHEIITLIQDVATKETRLGIPVIYGIDAIHGANYTTGATLFPQSIGQAATWNPDCVKAEGEIAALEMRACGIPWNFNPVLDLGRQPLWSRLWETYGEDPYLASVLGAQYVRSQEGGDIGAPNKVAACAKHYLGYSFPLSGKDRTPAWIPERMLREYFLPTFQAAADAGIHTVMVNSSEINGIPVHSDYHLLTEVLRGELGFAGFVVSDWQDIENLYTREKVAATPKEAVRTAVMAGVDMSMVPYSFSFYDLLLELVKEGAVPQQRIDEAVGRILKVKFELGLFDRPYPDRKLAKKFAAEESRAACLQAAQESITLLKNESAVLPIAKTKKVLVTGPTANLLSCLNSGWTITWQGNDEKRYPQEKLTILEAIEEKIGVENVQYVLGSSFHEEVNITEAIEAARKADVAIVCLGEEAYCETPGNINDLTLDEAQLHLAQAIEKMGIPVVLVMVEGRPRLIRQIADEAKGILLAFVPGMEGGRAVADVLFGDVNPSGKLPVTYPRYPNDLVCYDHKYSEENWVSSYTPQFPFGFGLSYTTFQYQDLKLSKKTMGKGDQLEVSVAVENTGQHAGKEVVQLYVSDLVASVTPAVKRLRGFQKVYLESGEKKTIIFSVTERDLSFFDRQNKLVVEPGAFRITVGELKDEFMFQ